MSNRLPRKSMLGAVRSSAVTRIVWGAALPFIVAAIISGALINREFERISYRTVKESLTQDIGFYRDALILSASEIESGIDACIPNDIVMGSQLGEGEGAFVFAQSGCLPQDLAFDLQDYENCFEDVCKVYMPVGGQPTRRVALQGISLGNESCPGNDELSLPGPPGCLYAWRSLEPHEARVRELAVMSFFLIFVPIVCGFFITVHFARTFKNRIDTIYRALVDFADGNRKAKVEIPYSGDEIGQLARATNTNLRRIQEDIIASTRMSASLSHQLLTPIRDVRSRIGIMRETFSTVTAPMAGITNIAGDTGLVREELDHITVELSHIVKTGEAIQRLLLAKRRRTSKELNEIVDLYEVCEVTATRYREKAAQRSMRVIVKADTVDVRSNTNVVTELLRIFLDNAIIYGPRRSTIIVYCEQNAQGVVMGVRDEGLGPPADVLDDVFNERVAKEATKSSRVYSGGNGIGLMTARQLADNCNIKLVQGRTETGGWKIEMYWVSDTKQ